MSSIINDQQGVVAIMLYQKGIEMLRDGPLSEFLLLDLGFADGKVIDGLEDME
jgi:hypothetical protein